jgi:hypothetical protein
MQDASKPIWFKKDSEKNTIDLKQHATNINVGDTCNIKYM